MSDYPRQYASFRSNIPQKKISISPSVTWTLYDAGSKEAKTPIIFLPPIAGQADVFFKQLLSLPAFGYRAIAVEYPIAWTVKQFCIQFHHLIDVLKFKKVHLFGAGLGGFLALKFAEFSRQSSRVISIVLCNSFTDSSFHRSVIPASLSNIFWLLPGIVLKRLVNKINETLSAPDPSISHADHFMEISLNNLDQSELSSRLTLNCIGDYVQPQYLKAVSIMIIESNDNDSILAAKLSAETHKCFPEAQLAVLKNGGTNLFLSRADHVSLFIQIHLKQFFGGTFCPLAPNSLLLKTCQQEDDDDDIECDD